MKIKRKQKKKSKKYSEATTFKNQGITLWNKRKVKSISLGR